MSTTQKKTRAVSDDKRFAKELASLNYGLATRERQMHSRENTMETEYKKKTNILNFSDLQNFIDEEIQNNLRKTTWKRLSKQYKLRFIKEYLTVKEVRPDVFAKLYSLLENEYEKLDKVDYDMSSTKINRLNFEWDNVVY